jgi:site-specific DNA-methyltransferase (adenine-specific)
MGKINKGLFTSATMEWTTPPTLFNRLNNIYSFTHDLACTPTNQLCPIGIYYDSLVVPWHTLPGWLWCNPPYGRTLGIWVKKAHDESLLGAKIVMLIPARTDTSYWHDYIFDKANIEFIRGRLKFSGQGSAPFPSALIRYGII